MHIFYDKDAGLCAGVQRTVKAAIRLAQEENQVVALGELVHNPVITYNLEEAGVAVITDVTRLKKDQSIIIRAHGIPPQVEKELKKRKLTYTDLTCPRVKKIHSTITDFIQQDFQILIIGSPGHPETLGHMGYAGTKGRVIATPEEAARSELNPEKHYLLISQTTISTQLFAEVSAILERKSQKLTIKNTICPAVIERQNWIRRYAQLAQASVIIGGKNSSNSGKLYEIAAQFHPAYWFEKAEELTPELLQYQSLALTAGASTPHEAIEEVLDYFREHKADIEAC